MQVHGNGVLAKVNMAVPCRRIACMTAPLPKRCPACQVGVKWNLKRRDPSTAARESPAIGLISEWEEVLPDDLTGRRGWLSVRVDGRGGIVRSLARSDPLGLTLGSRIRHSHPADMHAKRIPAYSAPRKQQPSFRTKDRLPCPHRSHPERHQTLPDGPETRFRWETRRIGQRGYALPVWLHTLQSQRGQ